MSISFTCPHCDTEIAVPNEYAGQTGPCSACGRTIALPAPAGGIHGHAPVSPSKRGYTRLLGRLTPKLPTRGHLRAVLWIALVALLVAGAAMVAHWMLQILGLREEIKRVQCAANLRRIGRALLAYEAAEGTFPPAYQADESGWPKHSWRVLILPYLDEHELYAQYDFDERWDGPNNLLLAEKIGKLYHCPSDLPTYDDHTTSYVMIVGPGTITDGPVAKSLTDLTDVPFDTILVAEAANSGSTAWSPAIWRPPRPSPAITTRGPFRLELSSRHCPSRDVRRLGPLPARRRPAGRDRRDGHDLRWGERLGLLRAPRVLAPLGGITFPSCPAVGFACSTSSRATVVADSKKCEGPCPLTLWAGVPTRASWFPSSSLGTDVCPLIAAKREVPKLELGNQG